MTLATCKEELEIIVDKFVEMESREHKLRHEGPAGPSTTPSPRPQMAMNASVLSIYGLAGSGKSDLCKSLQDFFFSGYAGRSVYLELPTSSTPSKLVDVIGRAFNLNTSATQIDQVMSSLKNQMLWRRSNFLAVDNINCDESCEVVRRILCYVIGPGSRVVLAARTLDLFRPVLVGIAANQLVGHEQLTYICDSMPMPSLTEEEATKLLLETTGQGGGNMGTHDQLKLMIQKDKVSRIVCMCGFHPTKHSTSKLQYLPLVVKRMGAMLTKYEEDVDDLTWKFHAFGS
ncbi:hypothetical protein GOP47_0024757 [Adiantum capillus-veneris]|uniref:ORC1/DEAH AAA+ ATPase domain-containing protein n=1 Tax=Adiantum capillus-veneris TaxID=13818 RepID=A0A9D4Z4M6_ADICA|nr:hypothetical protein GOP47_0024757 [Adiantum capillus-veneris]